MPGPPGSYYPNLPPPGSDVPMQPMMSAGAPYPPAYPSAPPGYGPPGQPPYPSPYPAGMPSQPALGFANMNPQQPPMMMPQQAPMMPAPAQAGGEYSYRKTYVVVPPADQNQRRDGDGMECCKCLLCCCGCIELCRCFGMCLKCICDSDD